MQSLLFAFPSPRAATLAPPLACVRSFASVGQLARPSGRTLARFRPAEWARVGFTFVLVRLHLSVRVGRQVSTKQTSSSAIINGFVAGLARSLFVRPLAPNSSPPAWPHLRRICIRALRLHGSAHCSALGPQRPAQCALSGTHRRADRPTDGRESSIGRAPSLMDVRPIWRVI